MRGQISILESITTIIIIFISFGIFFPAFKYESKWGDVLLLVMARDAVATADRLGILEKISFNQTAFSLFLSTVKPVYIISWNNVESKIERVIDVVCLCTEQDKLRLSSWVSGLKFNNIDTSINVFKLDNINLLDTIPSDVLVIFGNQTLDPYLGALSNYLAKGNGIILIGDPTWEQVQTDRVYSQIFGLATSTSNIVDGYYDKFKDDMENPYAPINVEIISYEPWKYFYNIPVPLTAEVYLGQIPVEGLPQPSCSQKFKGSLKIQACNISINSMDVCQANFWICDSSVYFDTNWNGIADNILNTGEQFTIIDINNQTETFTFYLSYVDGNNVGISFKPRYKLYDFIKWNVTYTSQPQGNPPAGATSFGLRRLYADYTVLAPSHGDVSRILLQLDGKTANDERVPAVILNTIRNGRTAWIANFTEEGVGDDERLLLISLLLWASRKEQKVSTITGRYSLGYETSYIDVMNADVFEPYIFTLGLGYPK